MGIGNGDDALSPLWFVRCTAKNKDVGVGHWLMKRALQCVCLYIHIHVYVCVCVCVNARVRVCVHVFKSM